METNTLLPGEIQRVRRYTFIEVYQVYNGSDGGATKTMYDHLERCGKPGHLAMNLFRALKNSARAKVYKGRGYRDAAYERKAWAMGNLCIALIAHADSEGVGINTWGWQMDEETPKYPHVLYIDLPTVGQVSFHNSTRLQGPDYAGQWDGVRGQSVDRIVRYTAGILGDTGAAA